MLKRYFGGREGIGLAKFTLRIMSEFAHRELHMTIHGSFKYIVVLSEETNTRHIAIL